MATPVAYEVAVQDIEYQRIGDTPMLARIYRPTGTGPFPTLLDVHGGAWQTGERTNDADINTALASQGILVAAIDIRNSPQAPYPASVADVNLGTRWLKAHAAEFGGTPRVGALGVSSGGHLVLLSGMRPRDPRYAALLLAGHADVDASLAYVIACWPVSDPLYRYRSAQRLGNQAQVAAHEQYWGSEDAMAEGNPPLILERGEAVELPPALVIQRSVDENHPLEMQQRLVDWYRRRGGSIEMPLYDNLPGRYKLDPAVPDTVAVIDAIADFIRQHA